MPSTQPRAAAATASYAPAAEARPGPQGPLPVTRSRKMLVLLLGCLEPFPLDRRDLADLRIAGMAAEGGEFANAEALVWEGTEAWSSVPPERAWSEPEPGRFILEITDSAGNTERGELEVPPGHVAPRLEGWTRTLGDGTTSLEITLSDPATVHWMCPGGTLTETGANSTDWSPVDDAGEPIAAGIWPVVALWFDGEGGNGWATFDVPVEVDGPLLAQEGRLLAVPAGTPPGPALLMATLTESDSVAGVVLTDVAVDDGTELAASPCGVADGEWTADPLLERRCGRDETVGNRVRVRGEVAP